MTNNVLLNSSDHKNLRVHSSYSVTLGDGVMSTPTFSREFKTIQAHYPIVFKKQEGEGSFVPMALLGLENNENLFLSESGWDASYVPMMMQRVPFSIGFYSDEQSNEKKRVLHIDLDHPKVSADDSGQRLFRDDGSITDYLERVSGILEVIHQSQADDRAFAARLDQLDLLEAVNMDIRLANGSAGQLSGFYTINEERLAALTSEQLGELHKKGWLEPVYMTIASLPKVQALVDRKSRYIES